MPPRIRTGARITARVGSLLSGRRVASLADTPTMRPVHRHLLAAFDLDDAEARQATDRLIRRVLDDIGETYARTIGEHLDAVVELRTRVSDTIDAAARGQQPAQPVDALLAELQTHLDALVPLEAYLREHPPEVDAARVQVAVGRRGGGLREHPRVVALRDRIHEIAADLDADAIERRLQAAKRLFTEGRPGDAHRILDDLERRIDLAETAPGRAVADDPATARERAREQELTEHVMPPASTVAKARDRLNRLQRRITSWEAKVAGLPEFARLRDRVVAELTMMSRRLGRGGHVSETELAAVAGLVDSIHQGIRDVTRPVDADALDAMDRRLAKQLATAGRRAASADPASRQTAEIAQIREGLRLIRDRTDPNSPAYDPQYRPGPDYARLRRQERRLGRRAREVYVDLSDPAIRAQVQAWFIEHAAPLLAAGPIGELLYHRLMDSISTRSELLLTQSPRTAGEPIRQTAQLRREFLRRLHEFPADYQAAFLDAARGQKDRWPRTSAGLVWEVDHVHELWASGADEDPNLMALPPGLHRQKDPHPPHRQEDPHPPHLQEDPRAPHLTGQRATQGVDLSKTGILADFRREFLDALQRDEESVDVREADQ